jgi:hypothetical protein
LENFPTTIADRGDGLVKAAQVEGGEHNQRIIAAFGGRCFTMPRGRQANQ